MTMPTAAELAAEDERINEDLTDAITVLWLAEWDALVDQRIAQFETNEETA